jgi:hypothetical protein
MNGLLRGTLLAALSGIALALAGCDGGGGNPPGASAPTVGFRGPCSEFLKVSGCGRYLSSRFHSLHKGV